MKILVLTLLVPSLAMADSAGSASTARNPVYVRCVNPTTATAEACGGGGGASASFDGGLTDAQLRASPVPVSGAVTVTDGSGAMNVIVDSSAAIAVTGPLTDTQIRATPVPVSGTVTANVGTGTQPVSGTFWQATQPVSLSSMPSTPVTGTFWQATQPVSGAFFQATQPVSGPATDAQLRAVPLPVSGTVTVGTLPALVAGNANIGDVDVVTLPNVTIGTFPDNEPLNVAQINGVTPLMGAGATGTGSLRVTVASDSTGFGTANGTIPAQSQLISTRALAYGSSPAAVSAGNNGPVVSDLEGIPYANNGHPMAVNCQFASAATATLLELSGCAAVASKSYYIKTWTTGGGVATAATIPALLRSGTGSNCATASVTLATAWHPAQSSSTIVFDPPLKATVAHAVCMIDATAGTKSATVTGYVAP